jgi:hypothetical protein
VTPAETKVAAAESKDAEVKGPEASPPTPSPLPAGVTREELASDIVTELKQLECYHGRVNGNWGDQSQNAIERFNDLSKLELPLDAPEQATLDALKEWKGPHLRDRAGGGPSCRSDA